MKTNYKKISEQSLKNLNNLLKNYLAKVYMKKCRRFMLEKKIIKIYNQIYFKQVIIIKI